MIVCVKDRPELIPEVAKVDCEAFGTMECYNLTVTSLKNRSDKFYAMVRHNKVIGVVGYDFSYQNCTVEGHEDVPFISDVCMLKDMGYKRVFLAAEERVHAFYHRLGFEQYYTLYFQAEGSPVEHVFHKELT